MNLWGWSALVIALWWLWRRRRRRARSDGMGKKWIAAQRRDDEKNAAIEYHGPRIAWPINKSLNEASHFNAKRLRKRA